jgi:thiosulfate dehydrogenase
MEASGQMNQNTPSPEKQGPRLGPILGLCAAIGLITVAATLIRGRSVMAGEGAGTPRDSLASSEVYGKRLIGQTTEILGPDVADPRMRYSASRLACGSCHIGVGVEPGSLSLATAMSRYPRNSPRVGGNETIQDRINGCMTRSMNGRALPEDSPEMVAMVSYLRFLADQDAAMGAAQRKAHESPALKTPNRSANLDAGRQVFEKRCMACHGQDGGGLPASADLTQGYVFPPLWGINSFNDGAGMHRVLTAARFIKAKMPLGKADLDDDQAFDVAAYINSKPRPEMAGLDRDYPDRTKKPVDTGYLPYADSFPLEQHRFGPFPPIEAYYKNLPKSK